MHCEVQVEVVTFLTLWLKADSKSKCVKSFSTDQNGCAHHNMLGCHTKMILRFFRRGLSLNVACSMNVNRMLNKLQKLSCRGCSLYILEVIRADAESFITENDCACVPRRFVSYLFKQGLHYTKWTQIKII